MIANPPPFLFQPGQRHYLRQRRWHILPMPRDVAEQLKPWPRAGVISIDGFGAKNGTNTVNAASVSLANGELVWASAKKESN